MSIDPKAIEVTNAVARMLAPVVADVTQNVITLDYGIPDGRYSITVTPLPYETNFAKAVQMVSAPCADVFGQHVEFGHRSCAVVAHGDPHMAPVEQYDLGDEMDTDGHGGYFDDRMLDR